MRIVRLIALKLQAVLLLPVAYHALADARSSAAMQVFLAEIFGSELRNIG